MSSNRHSRHRLQDLTSTAVWGAVQALAAARSDACDDAVALIVSLGDDAGARRIVHATIRGTIRERVTQAWTSGWQPADLHRYARRTLGTLEQSLVADAIADELRAYAPVTVDPTWAGQLDEIGATVWWSPDQTFLDARAARVTAWELTTAAMQVVHLLSRLPALEAIGPLPGTARPRAQAAVEVDQRILARVRALLAKAESTTYPAEAETFTAGAQSLMARHSIDAALLAATHPERADAPIARRIGIDNPYETEKVMLLGAVADANRCRTVWAKALGFSTVVGHAGDVGATETLFTSLLVQATQAMTREGSRTDRVGRSRTRTFRRSFLQAYAARIGERLTEAAEAEAETIAGQRDSAGRRELVRVLDARSAAVDERLEELFPQTVSQRLRTSYDAEGWASGHRAADRARLGGDAIEGGE
ncbi:DUF2786 domain-containing protein [Calidifontibacter sp. DB0510]|uniref:DUF2786 domain-containing protein n=1 Tax=Metallococcus carri TaxID=1656884 RepID=A0A967EAZ0_9MICO|nr:DUF2786 domain-containing protein [Metallococcus carri]NHN56745.1 DUF2786 domain-containing protein [Metallococcus carri]NOP37878.1 DUF2786 domain-containing protein [Calidifontibacter sp. DB2511S]